MNDSHNPASAVKNGNDIALSMQTNEDVHDNMPESTNDMSTNQLDTRSDAKSEANDSYLQNAKSRIAGLSLRNRRVLDHIRTRTMNGSKSMDGSDDDMDSLQSTNGPNTPPLSKVKSPRRSEFPNLTHDDNGTERLTSDSPRRRDRRQSNATSTSAISNSSSPTRRGRNQVDASPRTTTTRRQISISPTKRAISQRSRSVNSRDDANSPSRLRSHQREESLGRVKGIVSAFESQAKTSALVTPPRPDDYKSTTSSAEKRQSILSQRSVTPTQRPTSPGLDSDVYSSPRRSAQRRKQSISAVSTGDPDDIMETRSTKSRASHHDDAADTRSARSRDATPRASTFLPKNPDPPQGGMDDDAFWDEMKRLKMQLERLEMEGRNRINPAREKSRERHIITVTSSPHRKTNSADSASLQRASPHQRGNSLQLMDQRSVGSPAADLLHEPVSARRRRQEIVDRTPSRTASLFESRSETGAQNWSPSPAQRSAPSRAATLGLPSPSASVVSSSASKSRSYRSTATHQRLLQEAFDVYEKAALDRADEEIRAGNKRSPKGNLVHTMAMVVSSALTMNKHLRQLHSGTTADDEVAEPIALDDSGAMRTVGLLLKSSDEQVRSLTETLLCLGSILAEEPRPSSAGRRRTQTPILTLDTVDRPSSPALHAVHGRSGRASAGPMTAPLPSMRRFNAIARAASPLGDDGEYEEYYHDAEETPAQQVHRSSTLPRRTVRSSTAFSNGDFVPPVPQIPSVHEQHRVSRTLPVSGRRSAAAYTAPTASSQQRTAREAEEEETTTRRPARSSLRQWAERPEYPDRQKRASVGPGVFAGDVMDGTMEYAGEESLTQTLPTRRTGSTPRRSALSNIMARGTPPPASSQYVDEYGRGPERRGAGYGHSRSSSDGSVNIARANTIGGYSRR